MTRMTSDLTRHVRAVAVCAAAILAGAIGLGARAARLHAQPPATTADAGGGAAANAAVARGRAVYGTHCVECHGKSGRGDVPASPLLLPRPRDFTMGRFKLRSTE